MSPEFKSLIQGMLAADPRRRLTIGQVRAHPWFEGPQATIEEVKAHTDAWMEKKEMEEQ